jgi:hypothetical protein
MGCKGSCPRIARDKRTIAGRWDLEIQIGPRLVGVRLGSSSNRLGRQIHRDQVETRRDIR